MSKEFLIGKVYINDILASPEDKYYFWYDYKAGKVKARIYRYNGIIDVVTE